MDGASQAIAPLRSSGRRRLAIATVAVGVSLGSGWVGWSAWRSARLREQAGEAVGREDWVRAGQRLERLAWYRPRDRETRDLRIRVALARGEPGRAARLLEAVPESDTRAVEARLTAGRLWLQKFRPREAEAAFRAALRCDPDSDAARLALIGILAIQGRARDYEAEAWALHDRGATPIRALRLLAQAGPAIPPDTLSRAADEGTVLRLSLDADPGDPHTRIALARFERGRGRIDEALRLLNPLRHHPSAPPEARVEWAACLLDEGEAGRLAPFFGGDPGLLDGLGAYWLLRGEWADRDGRTAEALSCFRAAVRRDPRDPAAHYRLGRALRAAGREEGAVAEMEVAKKAQELKDLVARIPDSSRDADLLTRAGRICAAIGRDREARAWLSLALRAAPDRAETRAAYNELRRRPGDAPTAPAR